MFTLARLVTKSYKVIITLWAILIVVMAFFAIQLPSKLHGDGFWMEGEHAEVMDIASETFNMPAETMFLVFDKVGDKQIAKTIEKVANLDVVTSIVSPLEDTSLYSKDLSYALLQFKDKEDDMPEIVTSIQEAIDKEKGVVLTGAPAISKDINTASQRDLMTAEAIGLPIAIIVLLFAFGSVVASFIPLIIGISTILVSFGLLTMLGNRIDLSIFVLNIIPMLGLALSIDFALLFISRYREERKKSGLLEAVSTTIRTAGRSVLFSAFCVFIGLGAMMLVEVDIFQNIAVGGMIVVALAVLSSITLLPSILIMLGERINKWQLLKVKKNGDDGWRKFANKVIKRPILLMIFSILILGIAVIPVKNMELTIPSIESLPKSYDSRSAYEAMQEAFGLEDT